MTTANTYRYLVSTPGIRGGHMRIEDTRIGVHDVVGLLQHGERSRRREEADSRGCMA